MARTPSPATVREYREVFALFATWCVANGSDPFTPTPDDIGLYLLNRHDDGCACATIVKDRAAIRAMLLAAGMSLPPTQDRTVTEVMTHISKAQRDRARTRTMPVDMAAAFAMLRACDDDEIGSRGARDRAMLALSWALCTNLRRIVHMTVDDVLPDRRRPEAVMTARCAGAPWLVITDHPPLWRPVAWLREWLAIAGISDGPLFCQVHCSGRVLTDKRPLTAPRMAQMVKRRAAQAGIDPRHVSGMSLRFGRMIAEYVTHGRLEDVMRLAGLKDATRALIAVGAQDAA